MQLFAVKVLKDDAVRVVASDVTKETRQFYYIKQPRDWSHPDYGAFGYSDRIPKHAAHVTPQAALESYMAKRQRDKENARAVVAQATKQIASANEALMHLPPLESAQSVPAVGEVVEGGEG